MGTGRTIGLGLNGSAWGNDFSFNYYNPFYTTTGMGRGFDAYYQSIRPRHLNVSVYTSSRMGGDVNYNVPLGDTSSFQFGYGYQGLSIQNAGSVQQVQNFVREFGYNFDQIRLTSGWSRNSYDQMPYPTQGVNQQGAIAFSLPANKYALNYFKINYQAHLYQPLVHGFIFTALGNIGFGNTYHNQGLPFFENFFAGGIAQPGQVRGYESYSLGPQDNHGNAIGANLLLNGSAGVVLPYPVSRETLRTTLFIDAGNVFIQGTPSALSGSPAGPMRFSGGVSVDWRSPFGPLAISLAAPLNPQPRDQAQYFQFSMSSGF